MIMGNLHRTTVAALLLTTLFVASGRALAAPGGGMRNIDLTKGESIPADARHDWTLGATGARGWMFTDQMVTTDARQIAITKVDKGSPCDGVLAVGDVILGVGGKAFSYDPRTEFGKALTAAEAGDGKLSLTRWRAGASGEVVVNLPVLGRYSATAPYDCEKSRKILQRGCEALANRMAGPDYARGLNPIPRALNALALLAGGDAAYLPLVRREAQWAADFRTDSMATWFYGYTIMLAAEYQLATGDKSLAPGLKRMALEAAHGQSAVGSWGHKFAQPDGRLFGYGMMNAPGVPLTSALVMARMAGLNDPALDRAIERSARLLRFYIGKGAIPYGDHAPWTQTHEDNGKSGMAAFFFHLLDEPKGAEFFSRMALASHGAERDCGHTGNYTNILWAMPSVALTGPQATGAWMNEFGSWYYDFARRWDGGFTHQGPPQMKNDSFAGWDATGTFLLAYAMPLKKTLLTGKKPVAFPALDAPAAQAIIADGRGWNNKDRNSAYDKLTPGQLLEALGSWSPTVRGRAAMAIARRKGFAPVDVLVEMLDSPSLNARYGACLALSQLKQAAAPAVPVLAKLLEHPDLWLRVQAAEALAGIGEPAMATLPRILERLALPPPQDDPRGMEQRYLCSVVFSRMLKNSLAGVDEALLRNAIVAGLQNQDGRARGEIGRVYEKLSYEQIKPLLPAIHQAIVTPAPSGEMFASGIRLSGCELLARHRFEEGLALCLQVLEIDKWGKQDRLKRALNTLKLYGASAKPILPQLRQLETDLKAHQEARNLQPIIQQCADLIRSIEIATDPVELRTFKSALESMP
jgi:hypothetical protein